jgi:stage II sporulation protein D
MIKFLSCIVLLFLPGLVHGEEISVRIFSHTKPITFVFTPVTGNYVIIPDEGVTIKVNPGEPVVISKYETRVVFKTLEGVSILADTLRILPCNPDNTFLVRQPTNKESSKTLKGKLKIFLFPGSLMILNFTDIETYLPGAVRAEAGSKGPSEYFRTQAVIARTYVYRHLDRHKLDGYDLCDDVHCQVFSGMITEQVIADACRSTAGLVLVDKDSMLIVSAFHANCGGQTVSSGDVWVTSEPYLISIKDEYCLSGKPVVWERKISEGDWKSFLLSKGISFLRDTITIPQSGGLTTRQQYYKINGVSVLAEDIRERFRLKSTFFQVTITGENILIKGNGYGHGVGLCQDGARVMASRGMTYRDITGFYYPGTFIVNVKNAHLPERP